MFLSRCVVIMVDGNIGSSFEVTVASANIPSSFETFQWIFLTTGTICLFTFLTGAFMLWTLN